MDSKLTVIILFLNEKEEVRDTIKIFVTILITFSKLS